jgi:GTP-sensing pleiotropic transcriptional regulator CodY
MLLHVHRKEKLTIAKSISSRLSYSEVVSLPLESILSKISRYETDLSDSVVSFRVHRDISVVIHVIVKIIIVD